MSEDCLSMILYVPKNVKVGSGVPVMVWYVRIRVFLTTYNSLTINFPGFMAVHSLLDLRQMLVSTGLIWPLQLVPSLLSFNTAWEQLVYSVFLNLN